MIKLFTASWCQPCQNMKKMLEGELDNITIVDIDSEPDDVKLYAISSVPTFIKLNEEGNVIDRKVGVIGKSEFTRWRDE